LFHIGKQVIHPNQIDIVNEAFSPSPEKIEWARELVAAFEQQSNEGIVSIRNIDRAGSLLLKQTCI
jgi:citrate lyase beta subunit